ncbi:unnamed protein product (macronuclear) [Paramecium tetraurelia]|uniref:Protein kinase domain-containing protein n=1 Tax=Paramecium tetraurelia TaxID=5888 RepID=A0CHV0_PARTE|nr:uncharacterized protein GSPATT00038469001 [Paramecium tetraurelia]CAK70367.1 unnamed protein product [Paramecium tetraurelia]|eukprot:XP_001437764.1 hypothetical protein (macronuclear) [Paramecium tetraurelia strain d4-2]
MIQQNQYPQLKEGTIIDVSSPNQPIKQFKILELLGMGQEGAVYRAKSFNQGQNQNEVAIKFSTYIKENVMWFYQKIIEYQNKYELPNSSNYAPSNIIRIYDAFQWNNFYVLVMELGQIDLYKYIEQNKNKLTIQQKSSICLQILTSIVFIHSQNLFHRDIKPENYMMVDQQIKLIDFGLIKFFNVDQNRMTLAVGTKLFQAPEIIQGKPDYTMAVDVWAMAFVFYEIIKGTQLLDVKTNQELEEIVKRHISDQNQIYTKIDELQISEEWKHTIKRMLHPDPNQRITAREAQEKLSKNFIMKMAILNQTPVTTNFVKQQLNANNGQSQYQSLQQLITQQINALVMPLQGPSFNNNQQQQKEQSIKLLCNLKEQIIKALNQLENNPIQVLQTNGSDPSQENQKQNQAVFRKDLPPIIASKLNEIKKTMQEIEEKSISSQQEADLDDNFQKIKAEIEILNKITLNFENKQLEYKQVQQTVEILKQKQKMLIQKEILEETQKELQTQIKSINDGQLKRETDNFQLQINKLEQQMITLNYYQDQKAKQQQIINDLEQKLTQLSDLDLEVRKQKDEILDLRIKLQFLDSIKSEKLKNEQYITQLKEDIARLNSYKAQFEQLKLEIQELQQSLQQLSTIEADVKTVKEQLIATKAKLRELPIEKQKLENYNKEIDKLKEETKILDQIQQRNEILNQQIKGFIEQRNLKLEKEEEEKKLQLEKEQLEKDLQKQIIPRATTLRK